MAYSPPEWSGPLRQPISLEFVVGGSVQRRQELASGKDFFLVGRHAKQCDVVLDAEPKASRVHAVLQCKEGTDEFFVYDLGSSHGTLLNNRRLEPKTYTPVAVGHQLRFCAEGSSCLVVICGPDELMEEEGEVDLTGLRAEAAKEKREADQDLARRKAAKKERMMREKTRDVVAKMYAEKAQKRMVVLQEEAEKDRTKLHEVTWGMDADAAENPACDGLSEEARKLLEPGDSGQIDPEKVRSYKTLTDKQEQMVAKFEMRKKKLEALQREKGKLEGRIRKQSLKASGDDDTEFDPGENKPDRGGGNASENFARVEEKLYKVSEEVIQESDRILISLGLKTAEMSEKQKKERSQMYDTNLMGGEDDDFFDRCKVGPAKTKKGAVQGQSGEDKEFADLPRVGTGVETKESLEQKVKTLQSERAHIEAKVAMTEIAVAKYNASEEDELDAFMKANEKLLVTERLGKLKRRQAKIVEFLEEAMKMLTVAQRNSSGDQTVASVHASAAVAAAARKSAAAAAAAVAAASAPKKPMSAADVLNAVSASDALAERKRQALQAADKAASAATGTSQEDGDDVDQSASASQDSAAAQAASAAAAQAAAEADEAARKPLIGQKVYGAGPAKQIDGQVGGVQILAAPTGKRKIGELDLKRRAAREAGVVGPPQGDEDPLAARKRKALEAIDEATKATASGSAEMPPPKRKVYGAMLPPSAGAQAASSEAASAEADMPPPQKKVYGAMRPPSAQANTRSRDSGADESGETQEVFE